MRFLSKAAHEPEGPNPDVITMDVGTASGMIWADNEFGQIIVKDALGGKNIPLRHIRTLVARTKKFGEMTRADHRIRIEHERDQAGATKKIVTVPDNNEADLVAVGQEAYDRWGRDPNLIFNRAVKHGNISDVEAYRAVMRYLIRIRYPEFKSFFTSSAPRILIGVPRNATNHHLLTVKSVIENDLRGKAYPVWEQVAAAIGAKTANGEGIPFTSPGSCAIADLGGGTLDFAILSNGSVVDQKSYDTAGDDMDAAIMAYMRSKHKQNEQIQKVDIGYRTAIAIKEGIGSVLPPEDMDPEALNQSETELHEIRGASFADEMPGIAYVTRPQIRACLVPVCKEIVGHFRSYLRTLNDYGEVHADISVNGFFLTGGASLLPGLAEFIRQETGLKITCVQNPLTSVIDGLVKMSADDQLLRLGLALAS